MATILVTGGAGYIGSHTVIELVNAGYDVVIYDNFYNSKPAVLARVNKIVGKTVPFVAGDIRKKSLRQIITTCSHGAIASSEAIKFLNNLHPRF